MEREVRVLGQRFKKRRNPTDPQRKPSWFFTNGQEGSIGFAVVPLARDFDSALILGLLRLISNHTGLAAKAQLGYGTVQIVSSSQPFDDEKFSKNVKDAAKERPAPRNRLPNVDEMFFARVQAPSATLAESQGALVAALNLKFDLRATFRQPPNEKPELRHSLFGLSRRRGISKRD